MKYTIQINESCFIDSFEFGSLYNNHIVLSAITGTNSITQRRRVPWQAQINVQTHTCTCQISFVIKMSLSSHRSKIDMAIHNSRAMWKVPSEMHLSKTGIIDFSRTIFLRKYIDGFNLCVLITAIYLQKSLYSDGYVMRPYMAECLLRWRANSRKTNGPMCADIQRSVQSNGKKAHRRRKRRRRKTTNSKMKSIETNSTTHIEIGHFD